MPPGRRVARPVPPVRCAADALRLPLVPAMIGAVVLCVLLFGALVYAIAWALEGLTGDQPEIEDDDTPPLAGESWER